MTCTVIKVDLQMTYYKLLDKRNRGEVVRAESRSSYYQFCFGEEKRNKTNIMTDYFWPDSDICDEYEEISETEAFALINEQRERYDRLFDLAVKVAKEAYIGKADKYGELYFEHLKTVADSLNSTEYKIVAFLHGICEDTPITLDELSDMGFTYRIVNSVRILMETDKLTTEQYFSRLRYDYSARAVKIADLKHKTDLIRNSEPIKYDYYRIEKYKKAIDFLNRSEVMRDDFKLYD